MPLLVEALDIYGLSRYDLMVWFAIYGCREPADSMVVSTGGALGLLPQGRGAGTGTLKDIYLGMMQFMGIQLIGLILLFLFPQLVLWLPRVMSGG